MSLDDDKATRLMKLIFREGATADRVAKEAEQARHKRSKDPCLTKFVGTGGYPNEREYAANVFVVGQEYRCTGGRMGQSATSIEIEGVEGWWNSVLFDIDVHRCPKIQNMMISRQGMIDLNAQRANPDAYSCPPEPKNYALAQTGVFFVIPANPIGKPRMTRADSWKKRPAVLRYRAWCDLARPYVPTLPADPIDVKMAAFIAFPPSWSAKKKVLYSGKPHRQKPDVDNILKCMDMFLKSDCAIAFISGSKHWQDEKGPRLEITIK